jgi:hypothetical protein
MPRVTYIPNNADEVLDIDPATNQATVTTLGPREDHWLLLPVLLGFAVLAVIVVLIIGLWFMDLAFGSTS